MRKNITILILGFLLISCSTKKNQEDDSPVRETIDLSGPWSFKADKMNIGESEGWFKPGMSRQFWPIVKVPIAFDNCGPDLDRYSGVGWFIKEVTIPESFSGRRISMHFEGINYNAKVWVNGKLVGENNDAFLPFDIDINEVAKIGAPNTIAVSVNNIRKRAQFPLFEGWFGQGGFLREASLVATDFIHIANTFVVAEAELDKPEQKGGILSFKATVRNDSKEVQTLLLRVDVKDESGNLVTSLYSPEISVEKDKMEDLSLKGTLPEVNWWSPDSPTLYTLSASIVRDEKVVDRLSLKTGFRTIEVNDAKIYVNGEEVFLQGFNRHEDSPRTGMAVDKEQAREDLIQMKEIGSNYVRLSHYPHHPSTLDLCDEIGLFVLAENAMNEWGHIDHPAPNPAIPLLPEDAPLVVENGKRTLSKMVARDNHHPSILIWSISNENEESREDVSLGNNELIQFGKTLDKSRPWTHVSNSFRKPGWENFYHYDDVLVVNVYPTHWYSVTEDDIDAGLPKSTKIMRDTLNRLHRQFPEKPIIVGEYGFPNGDAGELGAKKQAIAIEAEFKGLNAPYVAGGAFWVYARHPWPWEGNELSSYGYVSRDRMSFFPAFEVIERLFKERANKVEK